MFRSAVRAARPVVLATRSTPNPKSSTSIRSFSTTFRTFSGPAPPKLFGQGGKAGEVPSDIEQATGLERLQLLGELEGIDVFDESPLDSSRIGTKANPILVPSYVCVLLYLGYRRQRAYLFFPYTTRTWNV
jgi:cytochrome c oxidase subunit 5b